MKTDTYNVKGALTGQKPRLVGAYSRSESLFQKQPGNTSQRMGHLSWPKRMTGSLSDHKEGKRASREGRRACHSAPGRETTRCAWGLAEGLLSRRVRWQRRQVAQQLVKHHLHLRKELSLDPVETQMIFFSSQEM